MVNVVMGIIPIGMIFLILTALFQVLGVGIKVRKVVAVIGFGLVIIGALLLSINYFINGIQ